MPYFRFRAASCLVAAALSGLFASALPASAIAPRPDYLVLDARLIERADNVSLKLGTVRKDPHNPLFKEDKPWEVRYDNVYANVIFDREAGLYKCWYSPFIVDEVTAGTPPEKRAGVKYHGTPIREMGLCYAVSRDGIRWDKPALGLIDYQGSTANNLVMRSCHGAGILKDESDKDPARRYKLFSGEQIPRHPRRVQVAFSPDGLHWSRPLICPDLGPGLVGDTHNNALWAPELGAYVGITRLMGDQRLVMRTQSPDFIHWSRATEALRGNLTDQTYAMPIFRYAGVYLGLVMIFHLPTDLVQCELAWSPDTIHWQRIDPGHALIPNSTHQGDYDWGCIYAAATPVVLPSEIRLYYGSSDGPHSTWRNGYFGLARLAPDRFAGYAAGAGDGVVETRPIELTADRLTINADASKGSISAELLAEDGSPLPGFSEAEAIACQGVDSLRAELRWKNQGNHGLPALKGQRVRLRFHLRNAKLYSFRA